MRNRQPLTNIWWGKQMEKGQSHQGEMSKDAAIVMVVKGSMLVVMGMSSRIIVCGEMFLMPPGVTHEYRAQDAIKMVVCQFTPEILLEVLPVRDWAYECKEDNKQITALKHGRAFQQFILLHEYYQANGLYNTTMQEIKRTELFCLMATIYSNVELVGFLRPLMDEGTLFRSFVTGNWQKTRNVEELAAMVNLSTSGFTKKFRKYFGEPPYKWMIDRKAECVLTEINSLNIPLKEIADKYNFVDHTHFWSFCKKHYGFSPTELRNKIKGNV